MYIKNLIVLIFILSVQSAFGFDTELRVAVPNPITSTDPFMVKTAQDNFIVPLIYESLFKRNLDGDLHPLMAKSFKGVGKGQKKLQIVLNDNLILSNGDKLSAKDVANSLRKYCSNEKLHIRLSALKGCHPSKKLKIKVKADNELEIDVETSYLYAVEQLSYGGIGIFREVKGRKIGTGSLSVKKVEKNVTYLNLNKHNSFWRKGTAKFSIFSFHFIPEKEMVSKIKKQQFHMASMYLRPTISSFNNQNYRKIIHAENVVSGLVLNKKILGLREEAVRKSLQKTVYNLDFLKCSQGKSKVLGMIPEGVGGYISDDDLLEDIKGLVVTKSKKLYDLTFYRHLERRNECEEALIIEVFKKHNLNLKIEHISSYKELFPLYLSQKTNGFIELFVYNSLDASSLLKRFLAKKDANVFFYSSKTITDNLQKASVQKTLSNRFKYYREINREVFDKANFISMYSISHTNIIHNCLSHKGESSQLYNPNSFLYLLKLDFSKGCSLEVRK